MTARITPWVVAVLVSFTSLARAEEVAPPPLMPASDEPRVTNPDALDPRLRLVGTAAGGILGTATGGFVGGLFSMRKLTACGSFPATVIPCGDSLLPIFAGMWVGSGVGVYGAGRALGNDGNFAFTMLGAGVGTVVVALMTGDDAPGEPLVPEGGTNIFLSLLLPTAGALLFNELSHQLLTTGNDVAPPTSRQSASLQLAPSLGATRDGGFAGLVGLF